MPKRLKFVAELSVVYGTAANVAGAAILNFRIGPSLSNRIESGRPIRIRIESRSFAGPYSRVEILNQRQDILAMHSQHDEIIIVNSKMLKMMR